MGDYSTIDIILGLVRCPVFGQIHFHIHIYKFPNFYISICPGVITPEFIDLILEYSSLYFTQNNQCLVYNPKRKIRFEKIFK